MKSRAFTLLELILVLGLIAAVAGLGIPAFHRMHVRSSLRAAAQQVQAEIYHTRLDAMKNGKVYVFRYRYGTSEYEIIPKDVFDNREKNNIGSGASAVGSFLTEDGMEYETNNGSSGTADIDEMTAETPDASVLPYQKTLPNGMIFGAANPARIGIWSASVLFYPNGRTSQTELSLQSTGRYEFRQEIILRGLTGTARFKD